MSVHIASGDELVGLAARLELQRQASDHAVLANVVGHVVRHQRHEVAVAAQQGERGQRRRRLNQVRRKKQVLFEKFALQRTAHRHVRPVHHPAAGRQILQRDRRQARRRMRPVRDDGQGFVLDHDGVIQMGLGADR